MTRSMVAILFVGSLLACGQKAEQKTDGQVATQTPPAETPHTRQEQPRPAIRQSDARVWIDPVTATKGKSGSFKVNYYGVEEAKAIVIPLAVPAGMTVDSISYKGSMVEYISTRPVRIDNVNHVVLMTSIPTTEANIPAKEGLFATVFFTLANDATSGDIVETFVPPGNYLTYVDTASTLVEPQFEVGKLTVQ